MIQLNLSGFRHTVLFFPSDGHLRASAAKWPSEKGTRTVRVKQKKGHIHSIMRAGSVDEELYMQVDR